METNPVQPPAAPGAGAAGDRTGTLDEALDRLHVRGPEFVGWLSNHGPMAVEALVRHGRADTVHRWLDRYSERLEEMPEVHTPITPENWFAALGDPRRIADWAVHFERETAERPWRAVLAEWWPRLLPGIAGGATHPVIRVGHAVRTLLTGEETAPRVRELAHALGYWAARHQPLPPVRALAPVRSAAGALAAVPAVPDQSAGIGHRLGQLIAFPAWPGGAGTRDIGPDEAHALLRELVTASVHRYATHGHGEPVMLVHAATAPNAVLRTLPALPRELWAASLSAAWAASAAVTAAYTPAEGRPYAPEAAVPTPEEVFERAAAHGDDHTIKFTDTALDVGDARALAAAVRSIELNAPFLQG
ncbi:questin oxidase family protein [Streptomyces sp. CAU 1734]|uniref:questin oxidase family protein n=1 Tax=Streptomyces sp. CAU 1734 TaxID=3140360 RepID=UPI00325FE8BF